MPATYNFNASKMSLHTIRKAGRALAFICGNRHNIKWSHSQWERMRKETTQMVKDDLLHVGKNGHSPWSYLAIRQVVSTKIQ